MDALGANATALALLLWETGLIGVALFMAFFAMVWRDAAMILRTRDDLAGAVALGWLGVLGVLASASIYFNMFSDNSVLFLFSYFSGYIAAQRRWVAYKEWDNREVNRQVFRVPDVGQVPAQVRYTTLSKDGANSLVPLFSQQSLGSTRDKHRSARFQH
jgi:hypothetical protein